MKAIETYLVATRGPNFLTSISNEAQEFYKHLFDWLRRAVAMFSGGLRVDVGFTAGQSYSAQVDTIVVGGRSNMKPYESFRRAWRR
jgi:hypothetical protein